MGISMSEKQEHHLQRLQARVVLFLDNDPAGREGSNNIGRKLSRYMTDGVFVAQYPDANQECQPDDLSSSDLALAISSALYPAQMKGPNNES
jgi:DNA primase